MQRKKIDGAMSTTGNYYELLGLEKRSSDPKLTAEDLKRAYRQALLQHHPDKNKRTESTLVTVDDIALAYKTLSEPQLRADYDRWLQVNSSDAHAKQPGHTGLETVDLDDLVFDEQAEIWSRSCRCGDDGGFVVTETELEKNLEDGELIVGCKGCSLWLRVMFSSAE